MQIDIENIMDEIRQGIKQRGESADILDFEEIPFESLSVRTDKFSMNEFEANLNNANQRYFVQPYKPLHGNPLFVFVKKVIRKLIKFYIEPVVSDQNLFNVDILRSMNSVHDYIKEQNPDEIKVKELEENLRLLELKVNMLQKQVEKS